MEFVRTSHVEAVKRMLMSGENIAVIDRPHPMVMMRSALTVVVCMWALIWACAAAHRAPVTATCVGFGAFVGLVKTVPIFTGDALYFLGSVFIATNRRVFFAGGPLSRRVTPLDLSTLGRSRLVQNVVGKALGYGTVTGGSHTLRCVKDPMPFLHAAHAAAHGVEGADWQGAPRVVTPA